MIYCYKNEKIFQDHDSDMIKYILPAIIVLLIVVFWEKITEIVFKKFKIRLNYIVVSAVLIAIATIVLLINYG